MHTVLCDAISRRQASVASNQVSGASVNLIPRTLQLVVAVRLRVVRVDTFAAGLFTSHFRTDQVAMSAGEPVPSWAPYFLSVTPHAILPLQKTRNQSEHLNFVTMQVGGYALRTPNHATLPLQQTWNQDLGQMKMQVQHHGGWGGCSR